MSLVKQKNTLAIITGAGPEAGIDLWQKILNHNKHYYGDAFSGDVDAPEIIIHSVPSLGYAMAIEQHHELLWKTLKQTFMRLSEQADYICLACNILHYFQDKLRELECSAQLVSIVDLAESFFIQNPHDCALLSISRVIDFGPYSPYRHLAKQYAPEIPSCEKMDTLIQHIKLHGGNHPHSINLFADIVNNLQAKTVILACTELPLLPLAQFKEKHFIDLSNELAYKMASYGYQVT